jgi:hypothetical protein
VERIRIRMLSMLGLELTYMARQWKSPEDPPPLYGASMASSEVDRCSRPLQEAKSKLTSCRKFLGVCEVSRFCDSFDTHVVTGS